jgi:hypothetical protein
MTKLPQNKLAATSLTLGLLGWAIYLLQWCFDLSLGILLAAVTAGTSAVCSTILDVIPFALWLFGIVTGHMALSQIKHKEGVGRGRAILGLVLNYFGLFFIVIATIILIILIATGINVGILDKVIPFLHK